MDSTLLDPVLGWIAAHPHWAYFIVALIAFTESLVIVGLIVPGAFLLFGVGALIGSGELALWPTLIAAAIGAILGDGISFWLGYHFRERLAQLWPFNRFPKLMSRGITFFKRHGGKSILFGRFVGPVRPIIPAVAGMMRMSVPKYISINLLSAMAWAPAYLLPAAFLVGYAKDEVATVTTNLIITLLLVIALAWLVFAMLRFCLTRKPVVTVVGLVALLLIAYIKLPTALHSAATITSQWQTVRPAAALQEYGWSPASRFSVKSMVQWFDPKIDNHLLPVAYNACAELEPGTHWSHPSSSIHNYFIHWCLKSDTGSGKFIGYRIINVFSLFRLPVQDHAIEQLQDQLHELFLAAGQSYHWKNTHNGRELVLDGT
ncbi:MAG: DedA family protein [Gammaproteobacteria bacterium]|nr:DedA family protein [Gammaproteobacteria bacterium]